MSAPERRPPVHTALTAWLAAANLVQLALGLGQSAILFRWLGVAGFGRLGWVLSVAMVADSVAQAGLASIVVRDVAASPRRDGLVFGTAVAVRAAIAAAAALFVWPLAGPWAALLVVAYTGQFGVGVLRAKLMRWPQIAASLLPVACSTAALGAAALAAEPSVPLALGILAAATLAAASGQLALARGHLTVRPALSLRHAGRLMAEAWPLWLSGFVVAWMYRVDIFLLERLLPAGESFAAIGLLQGATKPVESGNYLLGALVMTAFPVFSAAARDARALAAAFSAAVRQALLAGGAALVAALAFGPWALVLLYGESSAPAGTALRLLSPALVLVLVNSLLASLLTAAGRQRDLLLVTVAMLAFKFMADLAAIPAYSYNGCAAVTPLTEAFGLALLLWRLRVAIPPSRPALPGRRGRRVELGR